MGQKLEFLSKEHKPVGFSAENLGEVGGGVSGRLRSLLLLHFVFSCWFYVLLLF